MSHYGITYIFGEKPIHLCGWSQFYKTALSKYLIGYFSNNMYGYIPVFCYTF